MAPHFRRLGSAYRTLCLRLNVASCNLALTPPEGITSSIVQDKAATRHSRICPPMFLVVTPSKEQSLHESNILAKFVQSSPVNAVCRGNRKNIDALVRTRARSTAVPDWQMCCFVLPHTSQQSPAVLRRQNPQLHTDAGPIV